MVLQILLACFLWSLSFQGVASCLQCDPRFLKWVLTLLKETLPGDLPNRDSLITRHIQALADLHSTFLRRNYERIIDVRGAFEIKLHIINQLKAIKQKQWKGVFLWQLSMYQLRFSLRKKIHQILEEFADLACSEDCTVIEGPILDCWTCLRITTQCFDGEVCGVEDKRLAEYNEIVLYVFLVCESVITTSIILVYMVCFKYRKRMLLKSLAY
ncbi:izumo sperm-egg fusion protein 3 [Pantherophis guttatus]|uniref:Izumo sperm-egg fusion protein 3 n=1 Tax=Pantherophis guttatus TaxID=94885 RepID=A0A6P9BVA6_PANGU|nr:izumo sperm-egg fusion protein 3 [Pantherophis guttatus]